MNNSNTNQNISNNKNPNPGALNKSCLLFAGNDSLKDIVGQPNAIRELTEFKNAIMFKDIAAFWKITPPKGILFEGPPGTGKTASVRALANELKEVCHFMEITSVGIASRFMDAPIELLREHFKIAENLAKTKHVVIFIDEIDSMFSNRQNQLHEVSLNRVNTLLQWMDGGFSSLKGITIIGATNNSAGIDEAFLRPGRFDKIIYFQPLTSDSIIEALKIHLNKRKLDPKFIGDIDWNLIKAHLNNISLSGAEAEGIVYSIISEKASDHINNIKNQKKSKNIIPLSNSSYFLSQEFLPDPINTDSFISKINSLFLTPYNLIGSSNQFGFSMPS